MLILFEKKLAKVKKYDMIKDTVISSEYLFEFMEKFIYKVGNIRKELYR